MPKNKHIISITGILLLIIIIIISLYIHTLTRVELKDVTINPPTNISEQGFTLGGNIDLYNGGMLPVNIKGINYTVTLEFSGATLLSGTIEGKKLVVKNITSFPFSNQIQWQPSIELAIRLLVPGGTYARIQGTISVVELGPINFNIPFEQRIDLEQYVQQFVQQQDTEELLKEKIEGAVKQVIEWVS